MLEAILVLGQRSTGARVTEVAGAAGDASPSRIQVALARLVEAGIAERGPGRHPAYVLRADHAAAIELGALALRWPEPGRALDILGRANPAVWYMARSDDEAIVVLDDDAPPEAIALFEEGLARIADRERPMPHVVRFPRAEFLRLLQVAMGLRVRALTLRPTKGRLVVSGPDRTIRVPADET
ncbi:MAG: hypothetical protein E6I94_03950 [Chloroflexi bacterium]|nr:MAG: hypothetical protein E6I94_03950 [Chloroflexota bacterium]